MKGWKGWRAALAAAFALVVVGCGCPEGKKPFVWQAGGTTHVMCVNK